MPASPPYHEQHQEQQQQQEQRRMRRSYSLRVFRSFIHRLPDGTVDVSETVSRECFEAWLTSKGKQDCEAEARKFHRTLTNHVAATDGRCPFDPEEEDAMLRLFRRKQTWPCFSDTHTYIGKNYRSKGYHEKLAAAAAGGGGVSAASTKAGLAAQAVAASPPHPGHFAAFTPPPPPQASEIIILLDECSDSGFSDVGGVLDSDFFGLDFEANDDDDDDDGGKELDRILAELHPDDASFIGKLVSYVHSSFTTELTEADVDQLYELVRFAILGRTKRCSKSASPTTARTLCSNSGPGSATAASPPAILVLDLTTSTCAECVVAQNLASERLVGPAPLLWNLVPHHEIARLIVGVGAAYLAPGREFVLAGLTVLDIHSSTKGTLMNLVVRVDPESFYIVVRDAAQGGM